MSKCANGVNAILNVTGYFVRQKWSVFFLMPNQYDFKAPILLIVLH